MVRRTSLCRNAHQLGGLVAWMVVVSSPSVCNTNAHAYSNAHAHANSDAYSRSVRRDAAPNHRAQMADLAHWLAILLLERRDVLADGDPADMDADRGRCLHRYAWLHGHGD